MHITTIQERPSFFPSQWGNGRKTLIQNN